MISVIMASYNAEKYISETIESILNQTYNDFEFIIIDDNSSDETLDIITYYLNRDDRIKFFQNKINRGLSYSLNRAIELSKGE
jgi:glycosyltransferase EpsE